MILWKELYHYRAAGCMASTQNLLNPLSEYTVIQLINHLACIQLNSTNCDIFARRKFSFQLLVRVVAVMASQLTEALFFVCNSMVECLFMCDGSLDRSLFASN